MGNERSERCTKHGVRGCFVCFPIVGAKMREGATLATIVPTVPDFPNDEEQSVSVEPQVTRNDAAQPGNGDSSHGKVPVPDSQPVVEPGSHEEKVLIASKKYAEACTEHMKAQREVSKLRQELTVAQSLQEKAASEREAARMELQNLLVLQEVAQ